MRRDKHFLLDLTKSDGLLKTSPVIKAFEKVARDDGSLLVRGKNLEKHKNVDVLLLDGSKGYEKDAPYDRIIITAAAPEIQDVLKPA